MAIDIRAVTETLYEIEKRFDVNSLVLNGVQVWPIIRWRICVRLDDLQRGLEYGPSGSLPMMVTHHLQELMKATEIQNLGKLVNYLEVQHTISEKKVLATVGQVGEVLALFFDREAQLYQEIEAKRYNPILDPVLESFAKRGRVLKVELGPEVSVLNDRFHQVLQLNAQSFLVSHMAKWFDRMGFVGPLAEEHLPGQAKLKELLVKVAPDIPWEIENFADSGMSTLLYADFWEKILKQLKVRFTVLSCFYHFSGMGLNVAARRLGIPSIDIQHGEQGPYHSFYTHYHRLPEHGYAMLPNSVWVWGRGYQRIMQNWSPLGTVHHKAEVCGHPWFQKCRQESERLVDTQGQAFISRIKGQYEKVILVSLQYPVDNPVPDFLVEALSLAPQSWFWLIRFHPTTPDATRDEYRDRLDASGVKNLESVESTRLPLPIILSLADHHITKCSTVCHEAHAFDVPTSFIDRTAESAFAVLLNNGAGVLALTARELIESIQVPPTEEAVQLAEKYIDTKPGTLDTLVGRTVTRNLAN